MRLDEEMNMLERLNRIEGKIDKLIPELRDVSKCIASMKESMSCANPANHGRIGKMPRKQPKKKEGSWAEAMARAGRPSQNIRWLIHF